MIRLTQIHQIEITSRCNLRCRYCVHPKMPRAKQDMDRDTFVTALNWAAHFGNSGTQGPLNIAGIGESTMHPRFIEYLDMARYAMGPGHEIVLATNGLLVDDAMAKAMAPFKPRVFVSLHRPEKAGPAVEALKKYGLLAGVSADPSLAAVNWAGQVNWFVSAARTPCPWVAGGWGMVLSDGRVTRCCFDGTGEGVFAHVNDDLTQYETSPYSLCANCHHDVGQLAPLKEHAA